MPKIRVVTFATQNYLYSAEKLKNRCKKLGFESVDLIQPKHLSTEFMEKYRHFLSYERGFGYWIWKPFIIDVAARKYSSSDVILYLDSGVIPLVDSRVMLDLSKNGKIHVWEASHTDNPSYKWIHPYVTRALRLEKDNLLSNACMAGAILSQNSRNFLKIVAKWMELCSNPDFLFPEIRFPDYDLSLHSDYVWHRHDQSLLNVLRIKNPQHFSVHKYVNERMFLRPYFDIHRRQNSDYGLLNLSFPSMRILRSVTIQKTPLVLRQSIRKLRLRTIGRKKQFLTEQEIIRHLKQK